MSVGPPGPGTDIAISDVEFGVLEQIVQGKTLEEAGADSAFLLRVMQNPTLAIAFKLSREVSAYSLEEEAIARLRRAADDPKALKHGELTAIGKLVEQLRWSAEKRNATVFSSKAALNLTVPIQINTSLDMGSDTVSSAPGIPNIYELKAEVARDIRDVPEVAIRELGGLDPPEAGASPARPKKPKAPRKPKPPKPDRAAGAGGVGTVADVSELQRGTAAPPTGDGPNGGAEEPRGPEGLRNADAGRGTAEAVAGAGREKEGPVAGSEQ